MIKPLTLGELRHTLGAKFDLHEDVIFDISDVPDGLRPLIPYALLWGVADDWQREDRIRQTPEDLKRHLKSIVSEYDDRLDAWLAGEEAFSKNPSDAYVAFSAMRMGVDFI